jgi:hypothetical protein
VSRVNKGSNGGRGGADACVGARLAASAELLSGTAVDGCTVAPPCSGGGRVGDVLLRETASPSPPPPEGLAIMVLLCCDSGGIGGCVSARCISEYEVKERWLCTEKG